MKSVKKKKNSQNPNIKLLVNMQETQNNGLQV